MDRSVTQEEVKNSIQKTIFPEKTKSSAKAFSYTEMQDEELVAIAQSGKPRVEEYLIDKFKPLVKARSRAYFLVGGDNEDIVQEGMIGLFKAIRDFNGEKNASFRSFAELCINRQMITAIKSATRQKHQPLNTYISLNRPVFEDESEQTYLDMLQTGEVLNPESLFISKESKAQLEQEMREHLSAFETKVLNLYLQGRSYMEIGDVLGKTEKSIDNALQRVKKKLEKCLLEKNLDETDFA